VTVAEIVWPRVELSGARSNPFSGDKDLLRRVSELRSTLLEKAETNPREPRLPPAKASPVLETISLVLEQAGRPMRACEIHAAAERLAGMR